MIDRRRLLLASTLAAGVSGAHAAEAGLDLALVNGRVWTGVAAAPWTDAVGVTGDRIRALGAGPVASLTARGTKVVDLQGAFIMPAFIDNHIHFLFASRMLQQPDLLGAADKGDFVRRVGTAAARLRPGRWLQGGSWDEQRLGGELPDRGWIDGVTADVPFVAPRTDLHMYLVNDVALKRAGITRDTPDPPGGVIDRDAGGEPTGILRDNAKALIDRIVPPPSDAENEEALRAGIEHGLSHGVAQAHCMDIDWDVHDTLLRLRRRGETDMRFYAYVPLQDWARMADLVDHHGRGDDWVRWGGVKGFADGSLGSRTALFHKPYTDAPGQTGTRLMPLDACARPCWAPTRAGCRWRSMPSATRPMTRCWTSSQKRRAGTTPATAASVSSTPSTWPLARRRASPSRR